LGQLLEQLIEMDHILEIFEYEYYILN